MTGKKPGDIIEQTRERRLTTPLESRLTTPLSTVGRPVRSGLRSAAVPVTERGGATVYSRVGDSFALAATLSALVLLGLAVRAGAPGHENGTKCA